MLIIHTESQDLTYFPTRAGELESKKLNHFEKLKLVLENFRLEKVGVGRNCPNHELK